MIKTIALRNEGFILLMKLKIKVKLFGDQVLPEIIDKGDFIDLRSVMDYTFKPGEYMLLNLGVGMILPEGFEAIVVPRSSTYRNYGIMCTNSFGVIDNTYSGDNDQWKFPAFSPNGGRVNNGDRICQFRIQLSQKATFWQKLKWLFSNGIKIEQVEKLNTIDRGGIGSSGKR